MTPTIAVLTTLVIGLGAAGHTAGPEPEDPAVPKGTVEAAPATTGSTELAGQGKFGASDLEARHANDATELEISAGGVMSTGNAFAAAVTGLGRFRLRRGIHQLGVEAAGNYGVADVQRETVRYQYFAGDDALDDLEEVRTLSSERDTTIANLQARARYDVFFAERWSAFLMATLRRDRFQGLDLRFNLDPGVAFHVLTRPEHRLWFEAGYDFQFDVRREQAIFEQRPIDPPVDEDMDGFADTERVRIADDTLTNHAVRLFAGYNNALSKRVTFDTGLEYLQSVLVAGRFRINWVNALTTQLADRLGLSFTFTLRYEHQPLPNVAPLDTITAVLLTVRFI